MRFHLLDRIEEFSYGKYAIGIKCVSLSDDTFNEHFPGFPIFPGTLIVEGLAQLGGFLLEATLTHRNLPQSRSVLSIINHFKFKKPVWAGDRLYFRSDVVSLHDEFSVVKVEATRDTEIIARGELTFSFVQIDHSSLQSSRDDLYKILTRTARIVKDESSI